jgi:hypothetical protein
MYLTQIGFDDFRVVRDNLAGGHCVSTGRQFPFCLLPTRNWPGSA